MVSSNSVVCILGAAAAASCAAVPSSSSSLLNSRAPESTRGNMLIPRQSDSNNTADGPQPYQLPSRDADPESRAEEILKNRAGILYGSASLIGSTSFFIGGDLGLSMSENEQVEWYATAVPFTKTVVAETVTALQAVQSAGGLTKLSDYEMLYDGQWAQSFPSGIADGLFSNMTSDLLFAMERLSVNPYSMRRLNPATDTLPFEVDSASVQEITETDLNSLLEGGRLFYVDHSYQKDYPLNSGRHTAACSAYFYLDSRKNQLLPLAIKTGVGADLVYTPLDEENDWLLAKIMFNMNDLFHGQIYHLAATHAVGEIVYLPALRTISAEHPIRGLLGRLMYQVYAIRPVGRDVLFADGGSFDESFAINSTGVRKFATDNYPVAGAFRANFLETELQSRGLLGEAYGGPELPHFPFLEDGSRFLAVVRAFMHSFVEAYYSDDDAVAADWELQAWIIEANGPAEVIDFYAEVKDRDTLTQLLTHVAWLGGVAHHVLNAGEPVQTSGVLPMHPTALYRAPPEQKGGVDDVVAWLPDAAAAVTQISLLARFNRPQWPAENKTLLHMFDSEELLGRANAGVRAANEEFMAAMTALSEEIRGRGFDEEGLCQGMPFVWKAMDPAQIPFFMST